MLAPSRWKIGLVLLSVLFGLVFTLPNLVPPGTLPSWAPQQRLNLGLDLQGGSFLLYEVDTAALNSERLTNLTEDIRTRLQAAQIDFAGLGLRGAAIDVRIADPAKVQTAFNLLNSSLGEALVTGGRNITVAMKPDQTIEIAFVSQAAQAAARDAVTRSIEIIRKRIDSLGTKSPMITQQGASRIVIEAPGESDPAKLKAVIGKTAKLTFQMVDGDVSPADIAAGHIPPDDVLLPSDSGAPAYVVKRRAIVTGEMLTSASAGHDQDNNPDINMAFNSQGTRRFAEVTTQNVGKPFAIVLDGRVISAPTIQTPITGGTGEITGRFSEADAHNMALLLKSGALPAPLNIISQHTVGAELGADAVKAGQISILIGATLIFAFIILAYGLFGVFAAIALVVNGLMIVGAMSLTQATLTLPGIAGLVLTLAVAVDANVLIYERMRDEVRGGRAAMSAADAGFSRALTTIIDANVTTLVAAIIMFQFGSGPVKGFAWTLFIGVITSVFTAVLITQVLIGWWFRTFRAKILPIAGDRRALWPMIKALPTRTRVPFVRVARIAATLSILAILATAVGFVRPGLNLGIDFKGGNVLELNTLNGAPVDLARARAAVSGLGLGDVQVQAFGKPSDAEVRFQTPKGADTAAVVARVKTAVAGALGPVNFSRTDFVGPEVSDELKISGAEALLASIGLMLIYIWFRFELQFGLGAVVALFHDVTLSFGLILLLRLEFSLNVIAALLTIIGYSMNDTVVVFDRLRENRRKYKRMPLRELIDLSVNETLSRTVITGLTALLALSGLAIFGGESLRPLSVVLLFGIVVGTYSSIYVASPIILLWGVKRDDEAAKPIAPQPARP